MLKKVLQGISGLLSKRTAVAILFTTFFCVAMVSIADDTKVPADKSKFHIIVLMGQSNMAGSGHPVLPEYVKADPNVLMMGNDMKWTASRVYPGGGMGPGNAFARHYAELHPGITVGVIQAARGGRGIKELWKGGKDRDGAPNYDNLMAKVKEAMKVGTIKAILWHQGETDCGDAAYVDKLKTLATDVRTDIGDQDLAFIAGELGRYATWTSNFNTNIIPKAKTEIPNCSVASSEKLMDLGDKVHFSGFSCEILGSRYLMEYLAMKEPQLAVKFKPMLDDLTAKMLAKDSEWVTVVNPSMTEGETKPLGWDGKWSSKGSLEPVRDTKDFASAPASLRVESVGGPVLGSISTPLKEVSGKKLNITCKMKNSGFSKCFLVITGLDGSYKQALNKELIDAKDAKDWTSFSAEFVVPSNAVNDRLAILVEGEGKAWLDDIVIEKSAPPAGAASSEKPSVAGGTNIALNGNMSEGQDNPTNWTSVWTSTGKLKGIRDTQTFKSGPASIRIESDGGPVKGSVSQKLEGAAGMKLKVKGWAKCQGSKTCSAGIGTFDASWKMIKWINVFAKAGDFDWTQFEQDVEIPADAVTVNLGLGIDGEGSEWFDDIEVIVVK
ncbi:MAG TPA: hypothetical protein DET40_13090 [Lentisphaeria bacterium]|nr:MAG: hypothetical protein A2X45_17400 [Lentisphaerae bacterium GWF2_50_93]HCE44477.1 hypothetical protein [Lentisphaeria bacterium]